MKLYSTLIGAFVALTPVLVAAEPVTFKVLNSGQSRATFKTEAPLETIVGNTSLLSGTVVFDRDEPAAATARIEVDLASLRTGIDMRDEHLRSPMWLDTANSPKATFELTKLVLAGSLKPAKSVKGKAYGKLTIRGVTRDIVAEVVATSFPLTDALRNPDVGFTGDLMKIDVSFKTSFTNHGVQVPQMLFYKVSNDIDVQTSLTLVAQPKQTSNRARRRALIRQQTVQEEEPGPPLLGLLLDLPKGRTPSGQLDAPGTHAPRPRVAPGLTGRREQ